ncbi:beta-ketoacyl synthase N-terminal-like domain-containing protein [Micromonospora mangrovi]|uniref:Beta-ketoacyl synthase N-terminal-like domain-containing protein n=2 Tax=Micromonospora TaxID=1873 RepID=A0AAU8HG17_9ACTN
MSQDGQDPRSIAVVAMSCRYAPDLDTPERFWEFLVEGRSDVSEMPEKRWQPYQASSPQATSILNRTTRRGSFLRDIEGFDADFFGISPREAEFLDPQQRIILELAWEALERAGIPPLSLRGTDAGVYVAANSNDYGRRLLEDITRTGAWAVNGTTYYGIANRISYALDLRGPSMAVDTACAGSLTALHVACHSLVSGETPVAIVGGVNVMATPTLFVALDAAGATSPDGRSKAFDDAADGYGRGEGAGVLVLKRLVDAQRDGDPVLAVIPGSGVFQDGRSDGMMAPNGSAQAHMLRRAYERAGIAPETVQYVEAHGTGTPVGDREEANALAEVFGGNRPAGDPCLIGSVKPNIGHNEAGSGIAGIIKTVLALQHEELPPSLHGAPTSGFDWDASGLRLIGERTPWPAGGRVRRAGVSSYGVGGSIAHVIIEEAPAGTATPASTDTSTEGPVFYPLSAMSEAGLRAVAGDLAGWLDAHPDVPLSSVRHSLAARRSPLAQRAGIVADSADQLGAGLRALAEGRRDAAVIQGWAAAGQETDPVWVFSGHGSQWAGMGQRLLAAEPVFAEAVDELADVFRAELGWTPREALTAGGPWSGYEVQALTFAVQAGLIRVWESRGLRPGAVIGHSVGEIAAAVAAGCLPVLDAARFACRRAVALRPFAGDGGMALVSRPFTEVADRLGDRTDVVAAIAASPGSTVVSGSRAAVEELAAQWQGEGLDVRTVDTDIAFHSPHVDGASAAVRAAADELTPAAPVVPLYSTALADPRADDPRGGAYWQANLRQPVLFAGAVEAAVADGHRLFLEISSHPVVTHSITETLAHLGVDDGAAFGSLRRDTDESQALATALARLWCHGAAVDWSRQAPGALVPLPTMAWQHRPYWIFPENAEENGHGGGHDPRTHTLLGGRTTVSGAPPRQVWQTYLDMDSRPYPQDHEVVDVEITPAAIILNSFVTAGARDGRIPRLADVGLRTPLAVEPARVVQVVLAENTVRMSTRLASTEGSEEADQEWITHSTATIDWGTDPLVRPDDPEVVPARCTEEWDFTRVDNMFRRMGVGGYAFPWTLEAMHRNDNEQLARLTLEPAPARHSGSWAHVIDGALTISAVLVTPEFAKHQWMSCWIDSVAFDGEPPARIVVHSIRNPKSPDDTVDVWITDEDDGRLVSEVHGLRFSAIHDGEGHVAAPRELVHEVVWQPVDVGSLAERGSLRAATVIGAGETAEWLTATLTTAGVTATRVSSPEDLDAGALAGLDAVLVAPAAHGVGEPVEQAAERCTWSLIRSIQRLVDAEAGAVAPVALPRLWTVTSGVRDAGTEESLAHAPLWGTSRIIAGEHPQLFGGVIDLDGQGSGAARQVVEVLRRLGGEEDVISVGEDEVAACRLQAIERAADGAALQCRPTDTYLITGGLGALGRLVARWLADRGARRLLLAGRRALPPRTEWDAVTDPGVRRQIDGVLELEALGVTVRPIALDITDAEQVALALDPATHGLPPVRGIVHAAGVVRDALVDKVDREGLLEAMAPKVDGAMVLHRLFPLGSLDFFVMFSSCGQFARLTGQASYAAANSFVDALAAHRHRGGDRGTTSFGWTSWRGVGMSESIGTTMMEANSRGLEAVSAAEAFRSWEFADRFQLPYQAVLRVLPTPPSVPRPPMLRLLTATGGGGAEDAALEGFTVDWSAPSAEQAATMLDDVRDQVAAELNLEPQHVDVRRPLVEIGFDSIMTVALRVRLSRRYGIELPPNILWNKPTVVRLSGHILEVLRPEAPAEPSAEPEPAAVPA